MSTVNWSHIRAEEIKPQINHGGFLIYRCRGLNCVSKTGGHQCASKAAVPDCVYCRTPMEAVG